MEPFNLIGRIIRECYFINDNTDLVIEFTDDTKVIIGTGMYECELTGNDCRHGTLEINSAL